MPVRIRSAPPGIFVYTPGGGVVGGVTDGGAVGAESAETGGPTFAGVSGVATGRVDKKTMAKTARIMIIPTGMYHLPPEQEFWSWLLQQDG